MTYISTLSLTSGLRQSMLQNQAALAQATAESSSGVYDDLGATLGSAAGKDVSLKNEIDQLDAFTKSNALVAARLGSTNTALSAMLSSAQTMSSSLVSASTAGGQTSSLQGAAQQALQNLLAQLNTSSGSQYLFGGINSGTSPLSTYGATSTAKQSVDTAFSQAFGFSQSSSSASTITGAQMTSFLNSSFDSQFNDANWSANWSQASGQTITSTIAPGQTASTSVSANTPAFRQLVEGYTMLSEFTGSNMSADAKAAVIAKASSLIKAGTAGLNDAQSAVGLAQSSIDASNTTLAAQGTILKGRVSDMENVDPIALSGRVAALKTQIQTSYDLTSTLQSLSLVNYLKG